MGCCSARSDGRRNLACSWLPCCIRRFSEHGGLQPIAQHPAAADALQPPLRCGFQTRLSRGVTLHKLECPARKEAVHETRAHHRHALWRSRGTSGS
jgi:hypothetical protein